MSELQNGMGLRFEAGNAIFQSNVWLLQRLMTTISPVPINSDFLKMHKLDKHPKLKASWRGEGMFEKQI